MSYQVIQTSERDHMHTTAVAKPHLIVLGEGAGLSAGPDVTRDFEQNSEQGQCLLIMTVLPDFTQYSDAISDLSQHNPGCN